MTTTQVDGTAPTCTDTNKHGSSCTFVCSSGNGLSDNSPVTCSGDGSSTSGTWSSLAPTCSGKHFIFEIFMKKKQN